MEEKAKGSFWKAALIYGAILGVVGILLSLVIYFLNASTVGWAGWLTILISIGVLAYCLVAYRNEYLGGYATYGQIFLMGLMIAIISSILMTVYTYLLHTVIDPDLMEKMRLAAEERITSNRRIPESMYDELFEKMERRMTISRVTRMAMIAGTIFNAILSLIIAAFVKKEENPVNNAV